MPPILEILEIMGYIAKKIIGVMLRLVLSLEQKKNHHQVEKGEVNDQFQSF